MRWLLLVVVVVLAPDPASGGACAVRPLDAKLLSSADDAKLARGGGFVFARMGSANQEVNLSTWRIRAGARVVPAKSRELAPGLVVIDTGDATGAIALEDGDHHVLARGAVVDKLAELDAPAVRAVRVQTYSSPRSSSTSIEVELAAKAPAHAVALVAFGIDDKPRSFGIVHGGDARAVIYSQGRCVVQPAGTRLLLEGEDVQLAWVDDSGRLSKKSAKVAVTHGH